MEAADGQARAHAADGPETTTIAVVDADGNAASLILSVFADLGSGVVGRESGVLLNNRLSAFSLDPSHPNCVAPGKRTIHTLHSFIMVGERGELWAGGSPGGDHQPQVNLQVLARMLDLREEPGTAIGAPRWAIAPGTAPPDLATDPRPRLLMEEACPREWGEAFAEAGFAVERRNGHSIGSAKIVIRDSGEHPVQAFADRRREASVMAV
jgi:gamma-glutamyltranspeptidase/glutathione hydrolase